MNLKKIAILGTFDGIHEGHLFFIKEAKSKGDNLIAIVARDSVVLRLKGHLPKYNESKRLKNLLEIKEINEVVLGDEQDGAYEVLQKLNPQIVYLGYDQQAMFDSLTESIKNGILPEIELFYGSSYKPDIFHSSILNK